MKKKTYVKPLVSVCAIEALTFLADSTTVTPPSSNPVPPSGIQGGGEIENGDDDNVWE